MIKLLSNKILRGSLYGIILSITLIIVAFIDPPSRYRITEKYSFTAPVKTKTALAVLLPKTMAFQQISDLKVEGITQFSIKETGRLKIMMMEPRVMKDQAIILTYNVFLPKGTITWPGTITTADINPQPYIESDNPELITKSRSITSGKTTEDARKIYDFVSSWLKWPHGNRIGDSSSAFLSYKQKVGVCSDFARLYTAMLRANGIPARSMVGLYLPQLINLKEPSDWNHQAESHAWVEFYSNGAWHFADASRGGNRHFNRCDGFHLSYEEEQTEHLIYEKIKSSLISKFTAGTPGDSTYVIIGAMTAPLKFIAIAASDQVRITPKAIVKILYGYRMPVAIIILLLIIVFELSIGRKIVLSSDIQKK